MGQEAIRSYLANELAQDPELELRSTRPAVVTGGWAVDHGTGSITLSPGSAANQRRVAGNHLAVARRIGAD